MKKKTRKKLILHRETLAGLDRSHLERAVGGTGTGYPTYYTCPSFTCQPGNCQFSDGRNTCYTCEDTCTTNYC